MLEWAHRWVPARVHFRVNTWVYTWVLIQAQFRAHSWFHCRFHCRFHSRVRGCFHPLVELEGYTRAGIIWLELRLLTHHGSDLNTTRDIYSVKINIQRTKWMWKDIPQMGRNVSLQGWGRGRPREGKRGMRMSFGYHCGSTWLSNLLPMMSTLNYMTQNVIWSTVMEVKAKMKQNRNRSKLERVLRARRASTDII